MNKLQIKSYRKESRKDYGVNTNNPHLVMNNEQLQTGAILRIANAVEVMSKDYVELRRRSEYLEKRNRDLIADLKYANNRIRSYKGQITKLKNR